VVGDDEVEVEVKWSWHLCLFDGGSVSLLADERLVDVGDDSASGDGRLDQGVQLLVTTNGQLQVTGSDTLHLQILGGVACQLENLSSQVLEDGGRVDGSGGTDATVGGGAVLQVPMDTTDGELKTGARRSRHGLGLCLAGILACFASCHLLERVGLEQQLHAAKSAASEKN